jgi:hypothetical protein
MEVIDCNPDLDNKSYERMNENENRIPASTQSTQKTMANNRLKAIECTFIAERDKTHGVLVLNLFSAQRGNPE